MKVALSKIALVASDRELAESISAHFRAPRTYVSVIEAPKVRLEEYGVFERDCIHVTNAIKAQHPQLALLVSCSNKVTEKLRAHLPPTDVIDIKDFDLTEIGRLAGFRKHSIDVEVSYLKSRRRRRHIVAVEKVTAWHS